ncbi:MAG: hypothetical protein KC708_17825, partial [Anaerolineae bacterium]|nr:hypothetical protein [Anaerolineae bacterium]
MLDALLTYENFQLAWRRIRNSPINTTKDRLGLKVFSQFLDIHIDTLINELRNQTYEPQVPSIFYLPKKSGRLRPFTLLHMRDRLLYQAICNVLIQNTYDLLKSSADKVVFSPVLAGIETDFVFYPALRKGDEFEGQFFKFIERQSKIIESGKYAYVVYADIASFYPSIDHTLLCRKLVDKGWMDESLAHLLQNCLKVWSSSSPDLQVAKGVPTGYETSELLASLHLYELDKAFEDSDYLRYVDDLRIYAETEREAKKILNDVDMFLQEQGLTLQHAKSRIEELSVTTYEDRLKQLENQQILLSAIDRDVDSPDQRVQEETDAKLRALVTDLLGLDGWDIMHLDTPVELVDEAPFFFALYRMREKNTLLRDVALELIDSHPHRSYAIVRYLTLWQDDDIVKDVLWEIVDDESRHGQVRA